MKSIAIVILNWNGRGFLEQFLPSVVKHSSHSVHRVEVVVVDNGSTDSSLGWLKEHQPGVKVIAFDVNHGFAKGYNLGLAQVETDYYLILNSDVGVAEGWLEPLVDFMESNPKAGACMPKILSQSNPSMFEYAGAAGGFIDVLGYPFCRGRILSWVEADNGQYNTPLPIFWASGASMLVRSKSFWEAGGFDADFFAHMEEIDLCWRLKRMGLEIWCIPTSQVMHVGGGTLPSSNPHKLYLNYRNNLLMLLKNLPRQGFLLVVPVRFALDFFSMLIYLLSGRFTFVKPVISAYFQFFALLPKFMHKRRTFARKHPYRVSNVYPKPILLEAFLRGKRLFSELSPFGLHPKAQPVTTR